MSLFRDSSVNPLTGVRTPGNVLHMETKTKRIVQGHRITWFVYAGGYGQPLVKMPHTANMAGGWFAWDAECECGWASRTGGAIKASVQRDVRSHKYDVTGDWRQL